MSKFKEGDKVVPHSKTVLGPLSISSIWNKALVLNQPFLYVTSVHIDDGDYSCAIDINKDGDFFNESDLTLYGEQEIKQGDLILVANHDSELYLPDCLKRIFIAKVGDYFVCVENGNESSYKIGKTFNTCCWNFGKQMPQIPTSYEVKLNESHTAIVTKDKIKVGCQEFNSSVIKEISEKLNLLNK